MKIFFAAVAATTTLMITAANIASSATINFDYNTSITGANNFTGSPDVAQGLMIGENVDVSLILDTDTSTAEGTITSNTDGDVAVFSLTTLFDSNNSWLDFIYAPGGGIRLFGSGSSIEELSNVSVGMTQIGGGLNFVNTAGAPVVTVESELTPVPVPATLGLLATGVAILGGLGVMRRRKEKTLTV